MGTKRGLGEYSVEDVQVLGEIGGNCKRMG